MKEESDIFREYIKLNGFSEIEPLEYIVLRDSLDFQIYLLKERVSEFIKLFVKAR